MTHLGTAGYSNENRVDPFYPPGTPKDRFFPHYVQHFQGVDTYLFCNNHDAANAVKNAQEFRELLGDVSRA